MTQKLTLYHRVSKRHRWAWPRRFPFMWVGNALLVVLLIILVRMVAFGQRMESGPMFLVLAAVQATALGEMVGARYAVQSRVLRSWRTRFLHSAPDADAAWSVVRLRIGWWRVRLESTLVGADAPLSVQFMFFIVWAMLTMGLGASFPSFNDYLMLWLLGTAGIAIPLAIIPFRAKRRGLRTLNQGRCPKCGYDLVGSVPAFPDQTSIGPEKCPECGYDWPFVPPPIPGEFRASGDGRAPGARGERGGVGRMVE